MLTLHVSRTISNSLYVFDPTNQDTSYTINGRNEIVTEDVTSFDYDDNRNLTDDGVRTYAYDDANRMTSAGATTFSYDPLGALFDVDAHQLASVGGERLALYTTSGGALHRRIVPGARFDEAAAYYHGAGTGARQWPLADQLGSVIAYADAAGEAANINTYDEYGRPGGANAEFLQYTGQLSLASATGLYNYRNRFYQADIGRFMQTDPILYGDGLNLYAYVGNDPMNWIDPTGMERCYEMIDEYTAVVRYPDGREVVEVWHRFVEEICVPGDGDDEAPPGPPTSGTGGGAGDPNPTLQESVDLLCSTLDRNVRNASGALNSSYLNSWRWHSLEALRYDHWNARYNARAYADWAGGFQGVGVAAFYAAAVTRSPLAARVSTGAGALASLYDGRADRWARALEAVSARINQLTAQRTGACRS